MLDPQLLRTQVETVQAALKRRGFELDTATLARLLAPLAWRTPARAARKLQSFARAEQGSMLDLRLAAARTPSPARAALYLRHADDEARREAASASELKDAMVAVDGYSIPAIDWDRTSGRVLTLEWVDGIKISDIDALKAAGHDLNKMAEKLVLTFLRQAISEGYFHADMHQGNLFVRTDGTIVAIDFGIMGRINRQARFWLAEILYGLTTGNYKRVAEIHFEAQYVPSYHNVDEFATAFFFKRDELP